MTHTSTPIPEAIKLPASKSIGARYLVASFLAGSISRCPLFDDCDDLKVIQRALLSLDNCRRSSEHAVIDIHASGTAFRLMAAVAASTPGAEITLTGTPRLCSRPMAPLLDVLRSAGAAIEAQGEGGMGPYRISGRQLEGGEYSIKGNISSQFISALMLASPTWRGGMQLRFTTPLVSRPYAEMTARVMRDFGICAQLDEKGVTVIPGIYTAPEAFEVEADWSAAGFFYEAASFMDTPLHIYALAAPGKSLQGDAATATYFDMLGVESGFKDGMAELQCTSEIPDAIEADLSDNPDLVPAFAVACALNDCRFRFTGVRNLRVKECDRLAAMQSELGKLGYEIFAGDDSIEWQGERTSPSAEAIKTYDDHRIAMAFAIAALPLGRIAIADPDVVEKSFASFWRELPKLGLSCRREGNVMIVERNTAE